MKTKLISIILACSLLIATGCQEKKKLSNDKDERSIFVTENEIINNDEKNETTTNVEETTIPASEWTRDTVCNSILINGNVFSLPFTLRDLGEGIEIMDDEKHKFTYYSENKILTGYLSYYGEQVAMFGVYDCESIEEAYDSPISSISFLGNIKSNSYSFPVSINGVTIGDSSQTMLDKLYFMSEHTAYTNEETKSYGLLFTDLPFSVFCLSSNDKVIKISISTRM